ncbi:alpha,alpha-trehalose-phosphate synthase (UDP-forming) [Verticiella sediminum]|uniref:Trehalose-6-phosphate synthase n=1 Tax=Verticiella sediminum TaxID=1247510 RepID=A0A556AB34_9BURK|nr:alpha,alpha-trehalose-phosphate synthase (UDP-forming) [Verticiella sediminum]TSH90099.1 alpha,alpha-trehalose-phosphate synthase (UDP-forming) [Verticiella sediminum]
MARLVVVSNRVAPIDDKKASAGGLAVGLMGAMREAGGIWFGWNGQVSTTPTPLRMQEKNGITFATLGLNKRDYRQYYSGFSNATLWPIFHYRIDLARFDRAEYAGYLRVNTMLAQQLMSFLKPEDTVWVHDYHLLPFAQACRAQGARNRMGFFLHIPFPAPQVAATVPPHRELIRTMCSYDLVGFQTETDRQAFLDNLRAMPDVTVDGAGVVHADGHATRTGVYPIGVSPDLIEEDAIEGQEHSRLITRNVRGGRRKVIISVDRLDYSKGMVERFCSYEALLEANPEYRSRVQFIQIAPPSRSDIGSYQQIRKQLEAEAGRINGKFSDLDWMPIRYINKSYDRPTLMGLFRNAAVGYVTPLRDGMNLVAKEYVAAQDPETPGVLVLSMLAGAARELDEGALLVNPYDRIGMAEALQQALDMPLRERQERHAAMMRVLRVNDIDAWRNRFMSDLRQQ